jgi:hypothetical protein
MPSAPKDRDRGGGAGYDDQAMSSRDDDSEPTDADQVADDGAWGV